MELKTAVCFPSSLTPFGDAWGWMTYITLKSHYELLRVDRWKNDSLINLKLNLQLNGFEYTLNPLYAYVLFLYYEFMRYEIQ